MDDVPRLGRKDVQLSLANADIFAFTPQQDILVLGELAEELRRFGRNATISSGEDFKFEQFKENVEAAANRIINLQVFNSASIVDNLRASCSSRSRRLGTSRGRYRPILCFCLVRSEDVQHAIAEMEKGNERIRVYLNSYLTKQGEIPQFAQSTPSYDIVHHTLQKAAVTENDPGILTPRNERGVIKKVEPWTGKQMIPSNTLQDHLSRC